MSSRLLRFPDSFGTCSVLFSLTSSARAFEMFKWDYQKLSLGWNIVISFESCFCSTTFGILLFIWLVQVGDCDSSFNTTDCNENCLRSSKTSEMIQQTVHLESERNGTGFYRKVFCSARCQRELLVDDFTIKPPTSTSNSHKAYSVAAGGLVALILLICRFCCKKCCEDVEDKEVCWIKACRLLSFIVRSTHLSLHWFPNNID